MPVPIFPSKSLFGDKSLTGEPGPEGSSYDFINRILCDRLGLWKVRRALPHAQAFELLFQGLFLRFRHRIDYIAYRLSHPYLRISLNPHDPVQSPESSLKFSISRFSISHFQFHDVNPK
jgi:hypothetical protein